MQTYYYPTDDYLTILFAWTQQGLNNTSGRRFDFAPAELFQKLFNPLPSPGPDIEGGDNSSHNLEPWPKKWPLGIVPYYIDTKTYGRYL